MPLVRVSLMKGKPVGFATEAGRIIYEAMVEVLNVPDKDRFQVITEHDPGGLIYDPEYAGIHRTDSIVLVQITLNEGRSVELKKVFYKRVAERLNAELGVRIQDVFINLVEVKRENWSFGNGIAQYAV